MRPDRRGLPRPPARPAVKSLAEFVGLDRPATVAPSGPAWGLPAAPLAGEPSAPLRAQGSASAPPTNLLAGNPTPFGGWGARVSRARSELRRQASQRGAAGSPHAGPLGAAVPPVAGRAAEVALSPNPHRVDHVSAQGEAEGRAGGRQHVTLHE